MTLYILTYNNYYNRIVRKEDTLEGYMDYVIFTLQDVNFNPNDHINTSHVVGGNNSNLYGGAGDYVLVVDEYKKILSRWFIVEAVRTLAGQYRLTLRRDLIVDYYDEVIGAPVFVEKATLPVDNNLIFNSENMSYNQIKTSETDIKDATGSQWLVGYLARGGSETTKTVSFEPNPQYDYAVETASEFEGYEYTFDNINGPRVYLTDGIKYLFTVNWATMEGGSYVQTLRTAIYSSVGNRVAQYMTSVISTQTTYTNKLNSTAYTDSLLDPVVTQYFADPERELIYKDDNLSDIMKYNGKVVRVGSDNYNYYRLEVKTRLIENSIEPISDMPYNQIYNSTLSSVKDLTTSIGYPNRKGIAGYLTYNRYYLHWVDITESYTRYTVDIPAARRKLQDAPYDMFCFPVEAVTFGDTTYNSSNIGLSLAQAIYTQLTGSVVYDIQLLPYCPLQSLDRYLEEGISDMTEGVDYSLLKKEGAEEVLSIIFFPTLSSFKRVIPITIENPSDSIEFKVNNECDVWRICSPNYNGVFEFSLTRNGGLSFIELNCTYKPYTPYIHVNPNFGRLYGGDFNDARGLICGGDFSIAAASSAWQEYELQNKNYQKMFDRQIQNMEVKNNVQRAQSIVGAIAGTVQGTTTGAIAGGNIGGSTGGIIGGVVSGVASLAGGIADIALGETLRTEGIDYTKDMFGYQLGNIKALPQSLSKSSAFDVNTKKFPFIEYYTCSDVEKNALRNKIKYNGMTVMTIGTIQDYIIPGRQTYVKGNLIRLDIGEDFHVVKEIGAEINKGVFLE